MTVGRSESSTRTCICGIRRRVDWYPYLSGGGGLGLGDTTGMARRFDLGTYQAESVRWNVEKLVNVAAATGGFSIDESLELDRRAAVDGHPDVIVGGVVPAATPAESVVQIERQMAAKRFRGVRPMGRSLSPLPADDVLDALRERDLLFELMAHPDQLQAAARRWRPSTTSSSLSNTPGGRARPSRRSGRCGPRVFGPSPGSATTSCASCPGWRWRWARCAQRYSDRGSNRPSRSSVSIAPCSPATFPSTPCTERSTTCTRRSARSPSTSMTSPTTSSSRRTPRACTAADRSTSTCRVRRRE